MSLYIIKAVVRTDILKYRDRAFRYIMENFQETVIQFEMLALQKTACSAGRQTQGVFGVSEQRFVGVQGGYILHFLPKAGDRYCTAEMSLQGLKAVEDTKGVRS